MAEVRMNLLLMGKGGMGKSATGNTILGLKCFKDSNKMRADTKDVHCNTGRFEDIAIYVVDAPGLMDTETVGEERVERAGAEMLKALKLCGGEIDAFVLVIRYGTRFTQDDWTMLEIQKIIFGEDYFKHLIVVLTHGDSFLGDMEHEDTPNKSFDTWCDEQTGPLRQLFTACNGRIVLFNNREKEVVQMSAQRQQLIQLVKDLQTHNGKYTSETFQDAKELPDRLLDCGKATHKMAEVRMNLLLMGKVGVGKSSTGNTILGLKCFKAYSNMTAVTKGVHCNTARFEDNVVYVVDLPGLMDTETVEEESAERAQADMLKALMLCGGEIDAFVLAINCMNRYTKEDNKTLDFLKIIFGENYFNHLIVVLTHGDSFLSNMKHEGTPNKSIDTWCDEQIGPFKQLFEDCKGRFVLFNNREEDEVKMYAQRQQLIKKVKDLMRSNGKYTSENFEAANELRELFIHEQKAPLLQKNLLSIIGLLVTDIETHVHTPREGGREHIKQGIEDLQNELQKVDKTTKDYQYLMENVAQLQENLNNTADLHRLAQELQAAQNRELERLDHLTRAVIATFVLAASGVGLPVAVVCGAGTFLYAYFSNMLSRLHFKKICTNIASFAVKMKWPKTKNRQILAGEWKQLNNLDMQ